MSGEVAWSSVVCGTLVGVSVFSVMCFELLIVSDAVYVDLKYDDFFPLVDCCL